MRSLAVLLLSIAVLGGGLAACGSSTGNLAAGAACHASSECGPDLVCDFSQSPAVCAANGPLPADAAVIDGRPVPMPDAKPVVIDASVPDADLPDSDMDAM
jgi:hypothetical protein